jgi:threonine/homoserine/homoserine lactone efflux protein
MGWTSLTQRLGHLKTVNFNLSQGRRASLLTPVSDTLCVSAVIMNTILFFVAFLGVFLRNRLPYASAVSAIVLLFISARGVIGFIQHRRRFACLVSLAPQAC